MRNVARGGLIDLVWHITPQESECWTDVDSRVLLVAISGQKTRLRNTGSAHVRPLFRNNSVALTRNGFAGDFV